MTSRSIGVWVKPPRGGRPNEPTCAYRGVGQTTSRTGTHILTIGVEDFRRVETLQGLFQRLDTEVRILGDRQLPRQHVPRVPVHDRHQIHKAVRQWNVGDVGAPELVGRVASRPGYPAEPATRSRSFGRVSLAPPFTSLTACSACSAGRPGSSVLRRPDLNAGLHVLGRRP